MVLLSTKHKSDKLRVYRELRDMHLVPSLKGNTITDMESFQMV